MEPEEPEELGEVVEVAGEAGAALYGGIIPPGEGKALASSREVDFTVAL